MPLEADLFNTNTQPLYQRMASRALHLSQLGLNFSVISRELGVDGKTVAKAIAWLREEKMTPIPNNL